MKTYLIWTGREIIESAEPAGDGETELRETGQLDVNGRPIYECDIVKVARSSGVVRGVVEFAGDRFVVRYAGEVKDLDVRYHEITVVGNAFEEGP